MASERMTRADVRYVFVDDSVTPEDLAGAEALLSTEEQERSRRFHFAADRRQFVVAHALARVMLSHSRPDVPPAA
jgi:phosphopantetheinyl transferase